MREAVALTPGSATADQSSRTPAGPGDWPRPEERRNLRNGVLPGCALATILAWCWRDEASGELPPVAAIQAAIDGLELEGIVLLGGRPCPAPSASAGEVTTSPTVSEALSLAVQELQARGWIGRLTWPLHWTGLADRQVPRYLRRLLQHPTMGPAVRRVGQWVRQTGRPPRTDPRG